MTSPDHRHARRLLYTTLGVAVVLGIFIFQALLPVATGDYPYTFEEAPDMEGPPVSDPGILPPGLLVLLLLIDATAALALFLYLKVKEAE
ncbi:hypothetical protein AZH53_00535 [Methanomicrobiaceae archaeon CYW5]|uniref:hypothetical protein n=1 Tax=Methanovulcanius yangii TaxID=1789227 RepID=UPI0029CA564C|nr:hypothetical protein [Methanovulcanius yangii]MBT8506916.1 hypothetical protein [Methanovulcanius yangii]